VSSDASYKRPAKFVLRSPKNRGDARSKRKRATTRSADSDDKEEDKEDDNEDDDDDDRGGSSRCAAKKIARARSASCASSAARGAATGQGAKGKSSSKWPRASGDPHGTKAKRSRRVTPQLTEEQKAAAFAEKLARCLGVLPPHATNWGLGESIPLPDRDPEGTRCCGDIMISDEVLNKYGPLPRWERVSYMACFHQINKSPRHKCHV
jgi:hypothetical protein